MSLRLTRSSSDLERFDIEAADRQVAGTPGLRHQGEEPMGLGTGREDGALGIGLRRFARRWPRAAAVVAWTTS